jgi:hypothetical protein
MKATEIKTMLSDNLKQMVLPSTEELPCSGSIPVDNVDRRAGRSQDQNFLPNFLLFLLQSIWASRMDWFFGVDMGVYHTTVGGISQELLSWYDRNLNRYLTPDDIILFGRQYADQERQRAEQLASYLRSIGVDPDNLPS